MCLRENLPSQYDGQVVLFEIMVPLPLPSCDPLTVLSWCSPSGEIKQSLKLLWNLARWVGVVFPSQYGSISATRESGVHMDRIGGTMVTRQEHPMNDENAAHASSSKRGYGSRQRIGQAIKARRLELNMTLSSLARAADTTSSHLSRIERGLTIPSYMMLGRLATALEIDESDLRQAEREAVSVDKQLEPMLASLDVPESARHELLRLSVETRAALAEAFSRVARDDE
jgi:transcriptional regulator with XRE-family HTH domain